MPADPLQAMAEIRLLGEVVRSWDGTKDNWVEYPGIRPEGEFVGFFYEVPAPHSSSGFHRVVAYQNGHVYCTCHPKDYSGKTRCRHVSQVRAKRHQYLATEPYPCL